MNFKIIQPPRRLADYIRFFWFLEYNAPKEPSFIHHAFAHYCPEVLFCYKGQFKYKPAFDTGKSLITGVYGQTQSISRVTSNTDFDILGFYLYPHALIQLFQMPANELTNQSVDIKNLLRQRRRNTGRKNNAGR